MSREDRRFRWLRPLAIVASLLAVSCGSEAVPGPVKPTPVDPLPPAPANNKPVVDSITLQGRRSKEPASFADLGETIDVVAKVHDDETPVAELQYEWSASTGTFDGTGPTVTWRGPDAAVTPVSVSISLKVTEHYGYPGQPKSYQQDTTAAATLSLHNSTKELADMARQFLLDFSDSSIRDVPFIMRNFQPGCYGTSGETEEVAENRRRYRIIESRVGDATTTVNFGGTCPFRARRGDACTSVPVFWRSMDMDKNGALEAVSGTDWVASFYLPDQQHWRLCDSQFDGHQGLLSTFIR